MTTTDVATLLDRARAWAAEDPDAQTRAELEAIVADVAAGADPTDLADRFDGTLEFGTAGLRGELGAGPNRMNRVVVLRAAAGLAAYLRDHGAPRDAGVVIGYDARHNSDVFARDTAAVMTGAGLRAYVLPRPLPTPLLAFSIRELGCVAGVMVTRATTRPRTTATRSTSATAARSCRPPTRRSPRGSPRSARSRTSPSGGAGRALTEDIVDRYLDTVADLAVDGARDLDVVYTPLHGVGGTSVVQVLETAGFDTPLVVEEQEQPDPDFPTVVVPEPRGAGRDGPRHGAGRGARGRPGRGQRPRRRPVRGRRARAARLADAARRRGRRAARRPPAEDAASAASTRPRSCPRPCSPSMAAAAGQPYAETLTGFKWIGRVDGLAFGYEEALGYCVDPEHVRDKDGVSALLLLCEIAAAAKAAGRGLTDLLDDIAVVHGLHATDQLSVRVTDLAEIGRAMDRLRATPPTVLGGLAVEQVDDLSTGSADLPPTDGLRYRLADGARVIVRPSGTEPKLKCYLEVVVPVHPDDGVAAARIAAVGRLDALRADIKAAAGI